VFVEDAERKADVHIKLRNFQTDNDLHRKLSDIDFQRKLNAAWSKDKGIKVKRIPTQPNQAAAIPTKNFGSDSKAFTSAHNSMTPLPNKDEFHKLNSSV
jgi:hypothetical protein